MSISSTFNGALLEAKSGQPALYQGEDGTLYQITTVAQASLPPPATEVTGSRQVHNPDEDPIYAILHLWCFLFKR